jgi:hypothetical protein
MGHKIILLILQTVAILTLMDQASLGITRQFGQWSQYSHEQYRSPT